LVDELKIIAKLIKFNLVLKGEGFGGEEEENKI